MAIRLKLKRREIKNVPSQIYIYMLFSCMHTKLACTFGKIIYSSSVKSQNYLKYT